MSAEKASSTKKQAAHKTPASAAARAETSAAQESQGTERIAAQALIQAGAQALHLPPSLPLRRAAVQRLQSQTGNRSVTARIQAAREDADGIQRSEEDLNPITASDRDWIETALRTKDPDDVKRARNFDSAAYDEKLSLLQILLKQGWYGPLDQLAFERIWQSFSDPVDAAIFHVALWKKCVAAAPDLPEAVTEIAAEYDHLVRDFEEDVLWVADSHLDASRTIVMEELAKYQIEGSEDSMAEAQPSAAKVEQLRGLQQAGRIVLNAQKAMRRMEGMEISVSPGAANETDAAEGLNEVDDYDWLYAEESEEDHFFNPDNPPPAADAAAYAAWSMLKENYDRASGIIQAMLNRYPALFPFVKSESLDQLSSQVEAQSALRMIEGRLKEVTGNIDELRTALLPAIQDIDYRDLKPIHRQLFEHGQALEGVKRPWDESFYRWAAEQSIGDDESSQFWLKFGLSLAEVGLLLFGGPLGLGTAGLLASLGLGAAQAAMSWERAEELAAAADASMRQDLAVVSDEQASDAAVEAVLDTVFLAIDGFEAARGLQRMGASGAGPVDELGEIADARLAGLTEAFDQVPADLHGDIQTLYRRTSGFSPETIEMLGENPELLEMLLENPGAANLLKHCSNKCFPEATYEQITALEGIFNQIKANNIPTWGLKEFLYQHRDVLDWAIEHVDDTLDEFLTSGIRPAWMEDVTSVAAAGAKIPGSAGSDLPSENFYGLTVEVFWEAGGKRVFLTQADQLIGSHGSLIAFRNQHPEYQGWHSHHIIEEVHLVNLGKRSLYAGRDDLPCVLLPPGGHSGRLRRILGAADSQGLSNAELYEFYEEAYDLLGDVSGSNGKDELLAVVRELLAVK